MKPFHSNDNNDAALPIVSPDNGYPAAKEATAMDSCNKIVVARAQQPSYVLSVHHGYMFIDDDSVVEKWRSLAALVATAEREQIIQTLGQEQSCLFNEVGFCDKRPVQILSPFAIGPGPLRRLWMDEFLQRETNGKLHEMPLLLYWFDTSLSKEKPHITLESRNRFVTYEDGQAAGLGDIPKALQNKILFNQERSREDEILLDALRLFEIVKGSGEPSIASPPADHEHFRLIPLSTSYNMDAILKTTKPRKDNRKAANKRTRETDLPKRGDRVSIWWNDEEQYFDGTVDEVRESFYNIVYDYKGTEWLPLDECDFKIILKSSENNRKRLDDDDYDDQSEDDDDRQKRKYSGDSVSRHGKCKWTSREDNIIIEAVKNTSETPFSQWSELGQRLPGRSTRQIRERWSKHLDPNINRSQFSAEDDRMLWKGHEKLGNRWVEISDSVFKNTRSDVQLKNRWRTSAFKQFVADEFSPLAYEIATAKSSNADDMENQQNLIEGTSENRANDS